MIDETSLDPDFLDEQSKTNIEDYTCCICQLIPDPETSIEEENCDSDAIITKGIVNLLIRVLSERTPQEIIDNDLEYLNAIGLKEHLSPTRSNGLASMIKQIKLYAVAFKAKEC